MPWVGQRGEPVRSGRAPTTSPPRARPDFLHVFVAELFGDGAHGVGAAGRVFLPLFLPLLPGIETAIEER
jgi:hypothetical protein